MPFAEKIDLLRVRTERLTEELRRLRADLDKEVQSRRQEIGDASAVFGQQLASLEAEHATREQKAAEIDATGLPLIGVGIVLSAWPEQWLPAWLAIGFLALAALVVLLFCMRRFCS